jgi:hypothetical protein
MVFEGEVHTLVCAAHRLEPCSDFSDGMARSAEGNVMGSVVPPRKGGWNCIVSPVGLIEVERICHRRIDVHVVADAAGDKQLRPCWIECNAAVGIRNLDDLLLLRRTIRRTIRRSSESLRFVY